MESETIVFSVSISDFTMRNALREITITNTNNKIVQPYSDLELEVELLFMALIG